MDTDLLKSILANHGYKLMSQIGHGGSSVVYKIYNDVYQKSFVLKLSSQMDASAGEVSTLKSLFHPNIVLCFDSFIEEGQSFLILEDCTDGGSVGDVVRKTGPLPMKMLLCFASQIASGIAFLHQRKIAHLDIKPSNVLIDEYGRLKICDFGISFCQQNGELCTSYKGTRNFMAPEIFKKQPFDPFKADVYAFGVSFYFMAFGKLPWNSLTEQETLAQQGLFKVPENYDSTLYKIMRYCMNPDPHTRSDMESILKIINEKINNIQATLPKLPILTKSMKLSHSIRDRGVSRSYVTSSRCEPIIKSQRNPSRLAPSLVAYRNRSSQNSKFPHIQVNIC